MGAYIKDLKKPENCDVCQIFLVFTTCGLDRDHCMFQDVPESHGDLIDRDELKHVIGSYPLVWEYGQGVEDCWNALTAAKIVIPASKEG